VVLYLIIESRGKFSEEFVRKKIRDSLSLLLCRGLLLLFDARRRAKHISATIRTRALFLRFFFFFALFFVSESVDKSPPVLWEILERRRQRWYP